MGSCIVETITFGKTAKEAFDGIVKECLQQFGDDAYNGSFSTCDLCKVHTLQSKYSHASEKEARKLLESRDINKWTAEGVDMGIHHYEVRKSKIVPVSKSPKTRYAVKGENYFQSFPTLAEAKKDAMRQAMEQGTTEHPFHVIKYYGWDKGLSLGYAEVEVKTYKTRPKKIPKNAILAEIHAYYFMGRAAM